MPEIPIEDRMDEYVLPTKVDPSKTKTTYNRFFEKYLTTTKEKENNNKNK